MYQAVKRVDRNAQSRLKHVEYHILCNSYKLVEIVVNQLKGLSRYRTVQLSEVKKKDNAKEKQNAHKIYNTLSQLSDGKYKKSELRQMCEINNRMTWIRAEKVIEIEYGTEWYKDLGITITGQAYIIEKM